jgi:hypothetical protein
MAAAAGSDWQAAEIHFATALEQAGQLPDVVEAAHTRRWYAHMLLDRDGPDDRKHALHLLDGVAESYGHMNMPRHRALTEAMAAPAR